MLSLSTALTGDNNGQVTDLHSCDGIELLWMKCYVSCLCLCYLTILSVWTNLSGTDGQRHNAPVTIAKQIHCHIVCLSQIIIRSNVFAGKLWLCAFFFGRNITVSWKQIYSPQFEATLLLDDTKLVIINYKILTSSNQVTIWFKHFIIHLVTGCCTGVNWARVWRWLMTGPG